jgi:antitoxin CcdA
MSNSSDNSGEQSPQAQSKPKTLPLRDTWVVDADLMQSPQAGSAEAWLVDNQAALESSNAFVQETGLPLARFRNF